MSFRAMTLKMFILFRMILDSELRTKKYPLIWKQDPLTTKKLNN